MRFVPALAASLLLISTAYAEEQPGPKNGTFAGQQPRGQSVSRAATTRYDNYGQEWAEPRATAGTLSQQVQGHLAQTDPAQGPEIVGHGSLGK